MLRFVRARAVLALVSVTLCAALVVPTGWLAKLTLVAARVTVGAATNVALKDALLLVVTGSGSLALTPAVTAKFPATVGDTTMVTVTVAPEAKLWKVQLNSTLLLQAPAGAKETILKDLPESTPAICTLVAGDGPLFFAARVMVRL